MMKHRPLMIVFHCGVYFAVYTIFLNSIGRSDVEEAFANIHPDYIRNMLILLSLGFVGYIGLWRMRRWSIIYLIITGVVLIGYGVFVKSLGLPNFLPLLAGLFSLPLWPMLK